MSNKKISSNTNQKYIAIKYIGIQSLKQFTTLRVTLYSKLRGNVSVVEHLELLMFIVYCIHFTSWLVECDVLEKYEAVHTHQPSEDKTKYLEMKSIFKMTCIFPVNTPVCVTKEKIKRHVHWATVRR